MEIANTSYLAAFPIAYLTVWLGLRNPPRIPFGDLSYGVYLLHFPIEQTIMHLFPGAGSWWRLTLMTLPPTFVCAWLSWNLVEHPILSRKTSILAALDRAMEALKGDDQVGFSRARASAGPIAGGRAWGMNRAARPDRLLSSRGRRVAACLARSQRRAYIPLPGAPKERIAAMRAIGFAGWSGAGKTTLIVKLIPEFNRRGLSVSTIKHAHHNFDLDQPGKEFS